MELACPLIAELMQSQTLSPPKKHTCAKHTDTEVLTNDLPTGLGGEHHSGAIPACPENKLSSLLAKKTLPAYKSKQSNCFHRSYRGGVAPYEVLN